MKSVTTLNDFKNFLENNPGIIIFKFGATWCGPCKAIEGLLLQLFKQMPKNILCVVVDIDDSPELYSFLRSKRMINGVPSLICYHKGNVSYIPDDIVVGADPNQIKNFFETCLREVDL